MFSDSAAVVVDVSTLANANNDVLSTVQGLLVMGGLFLLGGVFLVYTRGRPHLRKARQFLGANAYDPYGGPQDGVAVRGRVDTLEETVPGPVTDEECVVYERATQEFTEDFRYDADRRSEMKRHSAFSDEEAEEKIIKWHTRDVTEDHVPFLVKTDEDTVLVDPAGARLDLPVQDIEQSSLLRRTLHRITTIAQFGRVLGTAPRRTIERHLKPGDSVLVVGDADEPELTDVAAEIADGEDLFLISTRSKRSLAFRTLTRSVLASLPGAVFLLLGLVFLGGAAVASGFV